MSDGRPPDAEPWLKRLQQRTISAQVTRSRAPSTDSCRANLASQRRQPPQWSLDQVKVTSFPVTGRRLLIW
jgi:hypothetical protein